MVMEDAEWSSGLLMEDGGKRMARAKQRVFITPIATAQDAIPSTRNKLSIRQVDGHLYGRSGPPSRTTSTAAGEI